ncbi:MAG: hypothetical protein ETSY1_22040 [Candidatus Entotheonella factor]|uniref:Uncharacterized protein n=1 Tax=Entotheonella factor TaxID=1429438 RepID=W4LI62_ENTF1|nr:MAG: hypothetical protein ETSY1_22040 [Candidatus Entotheonella factor]
MSEHTSSRPLKGLLLFAGIALVGTLFFTFVMSAVIPPIHVPDRELLIAELDHMATHFDWAQGIPQSHAEHCQNLIEEGRTRTETLKAFQKEFTRLDDQIAILFALGRVHVIVGECRFREALNPKNSHVKQSYLSQGVVQLDIADQALEDAHQRVVYALKAKRNRVYNLARTKRYLTENDVQTKLNIWRAYTTCLLQHSGQQQSVSDTLATSEPLPSFESACPHNAREP